MLAPTLAIAHALCWHSAGQSDPLHDELLRLLQEAPVADLANPVSGPAIYRGKLYSEPSC